MGLLEILGLVSAIATIVGPLLQLHPATRKAGRVVASVGVDVASAKRRMTRAGAQ